MRDSRAVHGRMRRRKPRPFHLIRLAALGTFSSRRRQRTARPFPAGAGRAAECTGGVRGVQKKNPPTVWTGRSCAVFLRGVEGGNQDSFQLDAFAEHFCIATISTFCHELDPIFSFRAFFQGDLKFRNKIGFAVRIKSFSNVGAYACSGTQKLMNQSTFTLCGSQFFARTYHGKSKCFRFNHQRAVIHKDPPFQPMITHVYKIVKRE